jgi:hypothetical protein
LVHQIYCHNGTGHTSLYIKKFYHFTYCHTTGEQNKSQSGLRNTTKQNNNSLFMLQFVLV